VTTQCFLHTDSGRILEIVITLRWKTSVISAAVEIFLGHARSTATGIDIVQLPTQHQMQTGIRNSNQNRKYY